MDKTYERGNLYKWMVLAISFLSTFVFAISLQALPPIFNSIMRDIPFSQSQAGFLMSAYSILGIFIPFFVAFFANKVDLKKMLILALMAVVIGLVGFSLSSSYILLLAFRLVSGAGATILVVISPLLITMFFDSSNIGIAMGIFNTAVPVGTVVSANLFGYLVMFMEWRIIITAIAIFTGIILMTVLFTLHLPKDTKTNESKSSNTKLKFNMELNLWLLGAIWMIANAQLLAYTTFGSQFFELNGMSIQKAGLLTSLIMLVSIFLTPIIGIIIDKTNQKKLLLLIGSVVMAIAFFGIAMNWASLSFWSFILGVGFAFVPVSIFSLLSDVVGPKQISMGLAVITAASNLGITVGPAGFGSLLDKTSGNFIIGFVVLFILSLISIVTLFGIKTRNVSDFK